MLLSPASEYEYLALEGGGAKGIIHIGVAQALDELGLLQNIKAISGASAGAISALVLATGWSIDKMKTLLHSLDFEKLASGGILGNVSIPYTVHYYHGLYDGMAFYNKFKEILEEVSGNPNITFEQWHQLKLERPELGLKDISVEACNIETRFNETFAWNTEHKDVAIADAVRASMGFPGYFTPWKIKGQMYSDGGLQKNLPSDVFEENGEFNRKVLSVKLDDFNQIKYFEKGIKPPRKTPKSFLQTVIAQVECSLNAQELRGGQYQKTTIMCDTLDIGTLQFDLTEAQIKALEASGVYGTIRYFYKLDPDLVKKHYDKETLKKLKQADFPICFSEFIKQQPKEKSVDMLLVDQPEPPTNVVSIDKPKDKPTITPLYSQWCKNKALKRECKRLDKLQEEVKQVSGVKLGMTSQ